LERIFSSEFFRGTFGVNMRIRGSLSSCAQQEAELYGLLAEPDDPLRAVRFFRTSLANSSDGKPGEFLIPIAGSGFGSETSTHLVRN
jgi:hypothetical protein